MLSPLPVATLPSTKAPRPVGKAASRTARAVAAEEEVGAVVMLKGGVLWGWGLGSGGWGMRRLVRRRVWGRVRRRA